MLPRMLVRQCGQRRMACTGHPAAPPLLTAERISHRPREQRVRQKCPGSEMIAVFGVRQPCCRECSSGNAVSASMACGSHAAASARPAMRSAQVWRAAAMLPRVLVRQAGQRKYGVRQPCCRTGLWPFLGGTCHAGTSMVYGIVQGYDHD
ncbi:MAG: hypothetical protein KatS3mg056_0077 [Chloroflexus sp.]|nr:MAG: hypothetical protein KatS3mg056_0077 [Chloroflexus sp.]